METSITWMESGDVDGKCRGAAQIVHCSEDMECLVAMNKMEMRIELKPKAKGEFYGRYHEVNQCVLSVETLGGEEATTFVDELVARGAQCGGNDLLFLFVSGIMGFIIGAIVILRIVYLCRKHKDKM